LSFMRAPLRTSVVCFLLVARAFCQAPLTAEELKNAKALDDDLAKQCGTSEEQCKRAYSMMLVETQVRLAEWGYGVKFTGEPDSLTVAAVRLYQQRNGLPTTGKVDGGTIALMDRDEKAVEAYPFTLPPFDFADEWPSPYFRAMGVFRDTATKDTSGPIQIECLRESRLCLEEESTKLVPQVATMDVKEWTSDHIVAEAAGACYTSQLRIERASKTVVHTTIKTKSDGPCKDFEDNVIKKPLASVYTEELVDGVAAQVEISQKRATAVHRVKLFTGTAESLVWRKSEQKKH